MVKLRKSAILMERKLFIDNMSATAKNVISSSNALFEPKNSASILSSVNRFSTTLEPLFEQAPFYTPVMEKTLDHSRESVRQFIKTIAQLFGNITTTLECV